MELIPRFAFTAFLAVTLLAVSAMPVFAETIFDITKNAMKTVYKDVAGIATVAAVVCAAVCLFLMRVCSCYHSGIGVLLADAPEKYPVYRDYPCDKTGNICRKQTGYCKSNPK